MAPAILWPVHLTLGIQSGQGTAVRQRVSTLRNIQVRALDQREYLVIIEANFCQFCTKTYVVTPHLNRLDETVQIRSHNIQFQ